MFVKLVEVGPRDGLQNEAARVPVEIKVGLIEALAEAGCPVVEAGAFVSPKWVPQMADHNEIMDSADMRWADGVDYPILVPNMRGFHNAVAKGARTVAVIAYPRISNLDEFQPLKNVPGVRLVWARAPADVAGAEPAHQLIVVVRVPELPPHVREAFLYVFCSQRLVSFSMCFLF